MAAHPLDGTVEECCEDDEDELGAAGADCRAKGSEVTLSEQCLNQTVSVL